MKKVFEEDNKFSSNGHIENNVKSLWEKEIGEKDKQAVVLVVGSPGSGKSTLTWWLDGFIRGEYSFKWWAFNHEEWMKLSKNRPKEKVIKYDEGRDTFYRRNAMKETNKEGLDVLSQYRLLNNFHIINFQNLKDMELDVVHYHAHLLLRVTHQGWVHGYGQKGRLGEVRKSKYGDKINWPTPDFRDGFPDFSKRFPELFEEYEKRNEKSLNVGDLEKEDTENEDLNEEEELLKNLEDAELVGVTEMSELLGFGTDKVYRLGREGVIDMYEVDNTKKFDKKSAVKAIKND